jgi:hypothetical protein
MSSVIRANIWQNSAGINYNAVLQVIHVDYGVYQSLTGADNVALDTGLVATITPRSLTSRILVKVSANMHEVNNSTVCRARIIRTGPGTAFSTFSQTTNMTSFSTVVYSSDTTSYMRPNMDIMWFDTPNTVTPCTYRLQLASNGGSQVVQLNGARGYTNTWGGISYITLMEIAQ